MWHLKGLKFQTTRTNLGGADYGIKSYRRQEPSVNLTRRFDSIHIPASNKASVAAGNSFRFAICTRLCPAVSKYV